MANENPSPKDQFKPGHTPTNTKHGAEGGIKAVQRGEPFRGLAAQELRQVEADLAATGRVALQQEIASRAHTLTRLYWNALQTVTDKAQEGDEESLKRFDNYSKRLGWLLGVAGRAWRDLASAEADQGGNAALLQAAVLAAEEAGAGE